VERLEQDGFEEVIGALILWLAGSVETEKV
jgi:hypothetical protein